MAEINTYYLLLGGNLPNSKALFSASLIELGKIGIITNQSSIRSSKPWGFESKNDFINQAIEFSSSLSPLALLNQIQLIEQKLGRVRPNTNHYQDRVIDIDILLYNNDSFKSDILEIPHKFLHLRPFALEPLCELCKEKIHPILGKSISQLLLEHNNSTLEIKNN